MGGFRAEGSSSFGEQLEETRMKKTLFIEGMACPRCLKHLTDAMGESGITVEESNLEKGLIRVEAGADVTDETMRDVVEEAGYELVRIETAG